MTSTAQIRRHRRGQPFESVKAGVRQRDERLPRAQRATLPQPLPESEGGGAPARLGLLLVLAVGLIGCLTATAGANDREEAHFNVAVSLFNAGQWEGALRKIDERQKQQLTPAMAAKYLYVRGLAHEAGGQADQAARAWETLLKDHANAQEAAPARVSLVYLEYGRGRNDRVLSWSEGLNLDRLEAQDRRAVALMRAEAFRATGKLAEAAAAYELALRHGADRASIAPRLFDLALRSGEPRRVLAASAQGVPGVDAGLVALARAEAQLSLGQHAAAVTEAAKTPADHRLAPRAAYVRAQGLIAQGKVAEAIEPLQLAIAKMTDPPAPPAARLALAECLLETGKQTEAAAALREAQRAAGALTGEARAALLGNVAMVQFKLAAATGDDAALIAAADQARSAAPAAEVPRILWLRLEAMERRKDWAGVIRAVRADRDALRAGGFDAPASLLEARALEAANRAAEAPAVLAGLIERLPDAAESLIARLQLANAAMAANQTDQARQQFDAILKHAQAVKVLGADAVHRAALNLGLLAVRTGDLDAGVAALARASGDDVDKAIRRDALTLMGQIHAERSQFDQAAAAWQRALALMDPGDDGQPTGDTLALMDRIARVWRRAGRDDQADAMWTRLAEAAGGVAKLNAESLLAWAGSLYARGRFADAAIRYEALFEHHGQAPARAYEAAASHEAASQLDQAVTWYARAVAGRDRLPESYAGGVDLLLARARLRTGTGDLGRGYWLAQLGDKPADPDDAAFDRAAHALAGILHAAGDARIARPDNQPDDKPVVTLTAAELTAAVDALTRALAAHPADHPRHYGVGALLATANDLADRHAANVELTRRLLAAWSEHEADFEPGGFSTTLAPAMLHYHSGEAARRAGRYEDALIAFETLLAVYPFNHWVDAASVGAARCYARLGDAVGARDRLQAVVNADNPPAGAERWRRLAQQLLDDLAKGS